MIFLQTIAVALSLYSAVPVPQFAWTEKNMRYAMAAFPLVGVLCGLGVWLWALVCRAAGFGGILTGAGLCLVPVLVTGGIHLDGFCDTADALASHAAREKKLEILKDSHVGAFAVISLGCYLLFFAAVCAELTLNAATLWCLALGFVLSRAASGLAVTSFPCAKNSGLVHAFADGAAKTRVRVLLLALLCLVGAALCLVGGVAGVCMLAATAALFGCYYAMSKRIFGGITGDLAGWFLQLCELLLAFVLLLAQKWGGLL